MLESKFAIVPAAADCALHQAREQPSLPIAPWGLCLADCAWTEDQRTAAIQLRKLVARYEDSRDLVAVGGYQPGTDEELDRVITIVPKLYGALNKSREQLPTKDTFRDLAEALAK